jgi:adenylate cyclase
MALLLIGLAWWPGGPLRPLDDALYDVRLRWLAPATADPQVVVIDIDERALAAHGRWPWPRRQLADLLRAAVDQGGARLVGLDLVLAQPDQSSGLAAVDRLAQGPLRGDPGFQALWQTLRPQLDDDAQLAGVLLQHPVVLGFHLSNEAGAAQVGALPAPLLPTSVLGPAAAALPDWAGHGGNLAVLQQAARLGGGHLNAALDADGTVRRLPLLVQYQQGVHPTLALAMARVLLGAPGEPAMLSRPTARCRRCTCVAPVAGCGCWWMPVPRHWCPSTHWRRHRFACRLPTCWPAHCRPMHCVARRCWWGSARRG